MTLVIYLANGEIIEVHLTSCIPTVREVLIYDTSFFAALCTGFLEGAVGFKNRRHFY